MLHYGAVLNLKEKIKNLSQRKKMVLFIIVLAIVPSAFTLLLCTFVIRLIKLFAAA
jgi:hypothetical protein